MHQGPDAASITMSCCASRERDPVVLLRHAAARCWSPDSIVSRPHRIARANALDRTPAIFRTVFVLRAGAALSSCGDGHRIFSSRFHSRFEMERRDLGEGHAQQLRIEVRRLLVVALDGFGRQASRQRAARRTPPAASTSVLGSFAATLRPLLPVPAFAVPRSRRLASASSASRLGREARFR